MIVVWIAASVILFVFVAFHYLSVVCTFDPQCASPVPELPRRSSRTKKL